MEIHVRPLSDEPAGILQFKYCRQLIQLKKCPLAQEILLQQLLGFAWKQLVENRACIWSYLPAAGV